MANEVLDDETIAGVAALESDPKLGPVAKCLAFLASGMDKLTKAKDKADDDEKDVKGKDTNSTDDYSGIDEDDDAEPDDDDETSEDGVIGKSFNSQVATEVSTLFDEAIERTSANMAKSVGRMLAAQRSDISKIFDDKILPLQKALDTAVEQNEELKKAVGATKGNLEKALGIAGRQPVTTTNYTVKDGATTGTLSKAEAEGRVIKAVTSGACDQNQGSQILQKLAKVETGQHVEFTETEQKILSSTK